MLDTLRHLLPDSTAWRLVVERTLKKYLRGVATVGSDVVSFVDDVYDDLWPDLTRELDEWMDQFGIDPRRWANDDDMRAYLDFRWGEDRGQSPKHLQDKLQAAGFDAYVYDSFDLTDVTLSTYAEDTYAVSEDTDPRGFCFAQSGYAMYVTGNTDNKVYQYALALPYQVSTATYSGVSFTTTTQDSAPTDVQLSPDGAKMFVLGFDNDAVYEYNLPTPYSVAGAEYVDNLLVGTKEAVPNGFAWKPDGTELYITGNDSDDVHQYTLGTGWDVSTAGFTRTYDPAISAALGISFSSDGTIMLVMNAPSDLRQYDLSTAWDISSAGYAGSLSTTPEDVSGFRVTLEGSKLFVLGATAGAIFRYRFGAWIDPLTYAEQPKKGNTQCGETGASSFQSIPQCGEEPSSPVSQTSLDSAVCNQFLANEVWYLVNDTLTSDAPPSIPTDSSKWGPFWYVGGTPIGTELEVDEYDRQRFEKLCLKHGPAEDWIVTIIEIWRTTLLSSWNHEDVGETLDTGEFQFEIPSTIHVKISDNDADGVDQSSALAAIASGDKLRFEKADGSWIEYTTRAAATDQTTHYDVDIGGAPTDQSSDWVTAWGGLVQIYLREST